MRQTIFLRKETSEIFTTKNAMKWLLIILNNINKFLSLFIQEDKLLNIVNTLYKEQKL